MSLINVTLFFKETVASRVMELLQSEFGVERVDASQFKFEIPPDHKLGHLAFACFPLAKIARKAPQLIATQLAQSWGESPCFQQVAAVGPYLNFHFSPRYLAEGLIPACISSDRYGDTDLGTGQTLLLEYSSPNTNKPLHLGHGRNNLLGSVLAGVLQRNGFKVVKANLVNDRGIHICKSMLAYQKWGSGETPERTGIKGDKLVGGYYILYDQKEKQDPEILQEVHELLRMWEAGDLETIALWKKMNGWVLDGFRSTYARMDVSFDKYYFESETYKGGRELVLAALEKGICVEEPNGAVAIDLEADKLGKKILLRGDGTSMYMTQDINTTVSKFNDYDLDGCLFVVGSEQDNHFRVLFKVLDRFGYEWAERCEHISYGMITLPEGKMKSREGTVVDLDDLMDEMKALALQEIRKRTGNAAEEVSADLDRTAEAIGQAAIKYFILRTNAVKEISFNPQESLSFDGATGPYLQYTHARICSLLRKAEFSPAQIVFDNEAWNPEETALLVQLGRFPDTMAQSATDRNPAVLCGYIYELCRGFNKFYNEHPILKAESDTLIQARISLARAVKGVLYKTLQILGIVALEKM
ncbi:MAG: arginine--tRNA ligase [SAR324 cluster bacterium]|nr:arginine--tRNA ligase [SAR324 cluster bacterium]